MNTPNPPLRAAIIPVTPLQQNSTLIWCTQTMRGAFTDPGGDLDRLKVVVREHGVTIEKLLITHGHIDHCGQAAVLAKELGVPIEGPHEADRFWITRLEDDGRTYSIEGRPFESDRWLENSDQMTDRQFDARRLSLLRPHARPCRVSHMRRRSSPSSAT